MKDSEGNLVLGRTRWRRFAAVALPAGVLGAGLLAGVANGFVPVALNVSGQTFKVSATTLDGGPFSQYGGIVCKKTTAPCNAANPAAIPVLASAIDNATLINLCQSVKVPGLPLSMVINADKATAKNLLIGMDRLGGNATFTNIDIGQDASTVGTWKVGDAGDFAQRADRIVIQNLRQRAYSTHAGTFILDGLSLKLSNGTECFPDSDLGS